ncbi:MAG: DUF4157 domain-containing protein [Cyanobacteria bacterium P01_G01_bin.54]
MLPRPSSIHSTNAVCFKSVAKPSLSTIPEVSVMSGGHCFAQKSDAAPDWSTTPEAQVRFGLINSSSQSSPLQRKATALPKPKPSDYNWIARDPMVQRAKTRLAQASGKPEKTVQRQGNGTVQKSPSVLEVAASGMQGSPQKLPHLKAVEQSFGMSMGHVQAYVGSTAAKQACAQLGAQAYALGNNAVFAGSSPDKALVGHEAMHTLQQGSGKVQARGEMGQPGDQYEQEADKVGDLVARGQSTAPILANYGGAATAPASGKVQLRAMTDNEARTMNHLSIFADEAEKDVNRDSGPRFANAVRKVHRDISNQVAAISDGEPTPMDLKAALWSLKTWAGYYDTENTPPREEYRHNLHLGNHGHNIRPVGRGELKCNRFVSDAYGIGGEIGFSHVNDYEAGTYPLRGRNPLRNGWPVSANELAGDGAVNSFEVVSKDSAEIGDIVSFNTTDDDVGGNDHTGINLGHDVYISARVDKHDTRPVPHMQYRDGIQIKWINDPGHNFREYTGSRHPDSPENSTSTPEGSPNTPESPYERYMRIGYEEARKGINNPPYAFGHYNNAIINFQRALEEKPGDPQAQQKKEEFERYKQQVRNEYDGYMNEGWAAVRRGSEQNGREQKIAEYNSALINFRRAHGRIVNGDLGARSLAEIEKVEGYIASLGSAPTSSGNPPPRRESDYDMHMRVAFAEARGGTNNPPYAYSHYNNAIYHFGKALEEKPGDALATAKLEEFKRYKKQVLDQYKAHMKNGWDSISTGSRSVWTPQQKIAHYNSAIIHFQRAHGRIATSPHGNDALGEIDKVRGYIESIR